MNKHFNKTSYCATLDPLEVVVSVRNAVTIIVKVFVVLNAVAIIVLVSVEDAVTIVVIILVICEAVTIIVFILILNAVSVIVIIFGVKQPVVVVIVVRGVYLTVAIRVCVPPSCQDSGGEEEEGDEEGDRLHLFCLLSDLLSLSEDLVTCPRRLSNWPPPLPAALP